MQYTMFYIAELFSSKWNVSALDKIAANAHFNGIDQVRKKTAQYIRFDSDFDQFH